MLYICVKYITMANLTITQRIKNVLKEMESTHPFLPAILADGILLITDVTKRDMENNPEKWKNRKNSLINVEFYEMFIKIVNKHLNDIP